VKRADETAQKTPDAPPELIAARKAMYDAALRAFLATGRLPRLCAVQNAGSGACRVLPEPPSGEDGMHREAGRIR
jgi:hypothetical protein